MAQMVVSCGGKQVFTKPVPDLKVKSRWSGDLEETRRTWINKVVDWIFPGVIMTKLTMVVSNNAYAAASGAEDIRKGFSEILDVFTALAEPILWFYALTACILIATKSKDKGMERLKQVGYAYAGIALLPTFFSLLRWVSEMVKGAITFG